MKTIEVYSCGMEVKLGSIECTIAEICIGMNDQIQYRVVWTTESDRHSTWVQAFEIEPNGKEYKTMLKVLNYT